MPRRPRPSHRASPRSHRSETSVQKNFFSHGHLNNLQKEAKELSNAITQEGSSGDEEEEYSYTDFGKLENPRLDLEDMETDEEDADEPRVSQWVDEDEFEVAGEKPSDEDDISEAGSSDLKKIHNTLSNLPLGTLRKAQHIVKRTEEADNDDDGGTDSATDVNGTSNPLSRMRDRVEWSTKPRKDIAKRSNKHAPTEVTSKKPVTRFRQVVELNKTESRDPRFLPVTGEFNAEKFHTNYRFLTTAHNTELNALRDNLKRGKKMLNNAPRHLKSDYEAEVQRLELAVKRAESAVNRDRADKIQREALQKASKDEREKRNQGKGSWYMKNSEKRELVARAKYETLAAEGGKRAVKKAIEKRQKKITQKEKKTRPFPKDYSVGGESLKRGSGGSDGARKRRRLG